MLIAQISDCHVVAADELVVDRIDPTVGLRRAIELINAMRPAVDVVLGTGDLVNDGAPDQYERLLGLLADLGPAFVPLPGNHDDRSELRARFPDLPAGGPDDPIDHVVDVGEVRIVCVDTTIPGRHDGRLTTRQLRWLDDVLGAHPRRPTVIAQHHPPFRSGLPAMDAFGLADGELEADVVARHDHVLAVVGGHYHRSIQTAFGGTIAACSPSTAVQLAPVFDRSVSTDDAIQQPIHQPIYHDEPPAMLLHDCDPAGLRTHHVCLAATERWVPSWARGADREV